MRGSIVTDSPIKCEQLDGYRSIFGWKQMGETTLLYTEDDGAWHLQTAFNSFWLPDFKAMVASIPPQPKPTKAEKRQMRKQ